MRHFLPLALAFLAVSFTLAGPSIGQGHGAGPPGGIPGPPPNIPRPPVIPGPPAGVPARVPGPPTVFPGNGAGPPQGFKAVSGPPSSFPGKGAGPPQGFKSGSNNPSHADNAGQHGSAVSEAASSKKLAKSEIDRAKEIARSYPLDYELDRTGALAIRGEIMVTGLKPEQLSNIEHAGFPILRKSNVAGLDLGLAVVGANGMPAWKALEKLKRAEPEGIYALNHVFFESASSAVPVTQSFSKPSPSRAAKVVVGLIDTGVSERLTVGHNVTLVGRNFAPTPSRPALHGTAVATLLSNAPGPVSIYAADVFGSGPRGGTSEALVQALGWMLQSNVPVINVSMVGPRNDLVAVVVSKMVAKGFTIVAPVGNDGPAARPMFPASYPGVVAVSASDVNGRLLPEASRVARVDFVAPGIATVVGPGGATETVRGTSFAAPIVSRLIADSQTVPDIALARDARNGLARNASQPTEGRKWYGQGVVGVNKAALARN